MRILVAGAGGFIGGHLVRRLLDEGHDVKAVDLKPTLEWEQVHETDNRCRDLRLREAAAEAMAGVDDVYNLACDMGGIGYITTHKAECMVSSLINTHLLLEHEPGQRYLFTSSACVYGEGLDTREENAYPADCEDGYGWEKLFAERMCRHFFEERLIETRVARLHNVYGPRGTWDGGREKAPAALCRKVAEAKQRGHELVELWGDGEQQRSFMYISDAIEGLRRIMEGSSPEPVNLGSAELVTINELADEVERAAGTDFGRTYDPSAPTGVRGRTSDNSRLLATYDWQPIVPLSEGIPPTYDWVEEQVAARAPALSRSNGL